jgi:NAD(P) transhydrogenase subunit beta
MLLVGAVLIGGAIGLWRARVVQMTGMPELIALLHSFVGVAAVLVGWNGHLDEPGLSGALLQVTSDNIAMQVLAAVAVLLASINIFGGFAVTRRMLAMFSAGKARS